MSTRKYKKFREPSFEERADLLRRLQNNDDTALNKIFDLYFGLTRMHAQKYVGVQDADDIAITTFERLWAHRHRFNDWNHMVAFMRTTTRNSCLTWLRNETKESLNRKEYLQHVASGLIGDEADIHDQVLYMRLIDAINTDLSGKKKEAVQLLLKNYKIEEVARELNISIQTAQNYKSLAYSILRQRVAGIKKE